MARYEKTWEIALHFRLKDWQCIKTIGEYDSCYKGNMFMLDCFDD
jgi:hypothetical protein